MIHLDLGDADEPVELRQERAARLPLAIAAFNRHGPGSKELTDLLDAGYQVARAELRRRQHAKCAFCEKREDAFKRPVEHFRPKKGAEDRVGGRWVRASTHYWWLAWSWDNLYFSCDECNRTGHKGSRFPLEPGAGRGAAPPRPAPDPLPAALFDLATERRLLVDPRRDQPLDHLQWLPVSRVGNKKTWRWTVEGRDERGDSTVDVLGLRGRIDEVNLHLTAIKLIWHQIEDHLRSGRIDEAQAAWEDILANYVEDPDQPFRGASWWAIESLCPAPDRRAHGLRDPPVPSVLYPPPP
jgi:hypothetical protein